MKNQITRLATKLPKKNKQLQLAELQKAKKQKPTSKCGFPAEQQADASSLLANYFALVLIMNLYFV